MLSPCESVQARDELLTAAAQAYPQLHGRAIRWEDVPRESRTWHAKLTTDRGEVFSLKERSRLMPEADWCIHLELQDYLGSMGAPVPPVLCTTRGELQMRHAGRAFRLARWIDGTHPTAIDGWLGTVLGQSLAGLHASMSAFRSTHADLDVRPRSRHLCAPNRREDWVALIGRFAAPGADQEEWYGEPVFRRISARLLWLLQSIPFRALRRRFVHGDAHAFNVVSVGTSWVWIDWEDARLDYGIVDLLWLALIGGVFDWRSIGADMALRERLQWDFMLAAIEAYSRTIDVPDAEWHHFPQLLELYALAAVDSCLRDQLRVSRDAFVCTLRLVEEVGADIHAHSHELRLACR